LAELYEIEELRKKLNDKQISMEELDKLKKLVDKHKVELTEEEKKLIKNLEDSSKLKELMQKLMAKKISRDEFD